MQATGIYLELALPRCRVQLVDLGHDGPRAQLAGPLLPTQLLGQDVKVEHAFFEERGNAVDVCLRLSDGSASTLRPLANAAAQITGGRPGDVTQAVVARDLSSEDAIHLKRRVDGAHSLTVVGFGVF